MGLRPLVCMALMAGLVASRAGAQAATESLTDAAQREKERRKSAPKGKTYTETNLPKPAVVGFERTDEPATEESQSSAATPPSGKPEKTVDEIRAEKKAGYEKRIAEQVKTIDVVRKAMDDAQLELNDVNTITQFGSRKDALLKILDDGQVELKKADQAISDIEEEARREGISVSRP
jgi:hypothetical protein